jgi:hypothetical protein
VHDRRMFILRFRFENHASFRDETTLNLVQDRLNTSRPIDDTWANYTHSVAAIYGPNASGKSALLDALRYMQMTVRDSASQWSHKRKLPRTPFRLDDESVARPSSFVLDFVIDDVRYEYGFSLTSESITEEWLYTFPTGRKRLMFERGIDGNGLEVGRALKGGEVTLERSTGPRELVLSKGALLGNQQLLVLWSALTDQIDITGFDDASRQNRLRMVTSEVADGSLEMDDLRMMLKVADVGIAGAEISERKADPKIARMVRAIFEAQRSVNEDVPKAEIDEPDSDLSDDDVEAVLKEVGRRLLFEHVGADEKTFSLPTEMQSTGTLTWLSLAAPALKALRRGSVFVVDELDASLHPQLAQVMIQMFADKEINTRHAQIVLTTHDTYFISPTSELKLDAGEIWFVEKSRDGRSDLFSLEDFPIRDDQNFSRRYLQGRYGAVPSVAPAFLASLVEKSPSETLDVVSDRELTK